MKNTVFALFSMAAVCLFAASLFAQNAPPPPFDDVPPPAGYKPLALEESAALQKVLDEAIAETVKKFAAKNLKAENIAVTAIDLGREANDPRWASVRGEEKIYPASVVKMFYMAALENWLERGRVKMTPELERGLRDMIVDSSNEATQYILDVLTGTSSGGEMPEEAFRAWAHKRNVVNRFYSSMGYRNINVNQKTFCEDAYGVEQQFRNYRGENRNMITTNATARLLAEIVAGRLSTPERTRRMMDLMKRDFSGETKDPDDQAHGFTGIALINRKMTDARLWSKAGWTSKARHDAAYIETADGRKLVIAVYTENVANERDIIPTVAGYVLDNLKRAGN